jgi:gliding motility-associated-like protein
MKKLFIKGFYIVSVIFLFVGAALPASAQFAATNLETGGLYTAIAKDITNNLYVTRVKSGSSGAIYEVVKYTNGTGTATVIYTGLTHEVSDFPWGLAVTSTGDVYISTDFTSNSGAIIKLVYAGGVYSPVTYQTGSYYSALALDASNNLYAAQYDAIHSKYAVVKYPAGSAPNTTGTALYSNLNQGAGYAYPTGLTIAANGDVYVADAFSNTPGVSDGGSIKKLTAASAYAASTISSGRYSSALALDAAGNLYSSENSGSGYQLVEYISATGSGTPLYGLLHTNGFYYPWGIAIFNSSKIFVVDGDDGTNGGAVIQLLYSAPLSTTNAATAISQSGATLSGQVNDNGNTTTVSFIYGTSPTLLGAATTPATTNGTINAGNGNTNTSVTLGGLSPSTTYYFQVSATNSSGTTKGSILNFTTSSGALSVSYAGPQTYTVNTLITPLTPTSSGVAALAYSTSPSVIGQGLNLPDGVAVDVSGNIYVADRGNNAVKKIVGGVGLPVTIGTGFSQPYGVAVDAAGNVYVADYGNNAVKKILASDGSTTTLGTGFSGPTGVAVDALGNVFVADRGNNAVKKIPVGGGAPVTLGSGFSFPTGVSLDAAGNVYVADYGNNAVKQIPVGGGAPVIIGAGFNSPAGVSVVANGNVYVADYGNNAVKKVHGGTTVAVTVASGFSQPFGIATDAAGNIYVADQGNSAIKKILASNGTITSVGVSFNMPTAVASDAAGNIYVADYGNSAVKKIPAGGGVPVVLGSGFNHPIGIAVDAAGNIYVGDYQNNAVKKIPVGGGAPVIIGSGFNGPNGVAVDAAGNVFVADKANNAVKKIPVGGGAPVTLGSGFNNPTGVAVDVQGNVYVADFANNAVKQIPVGGGAPVTIGTGFNHPQGVSVDCAGNVFVADQTNNAVKEILASNGSTITIGSGFNQPTGVTTDAAGNLYVADFFNNAVKKVKPVGGYYISAALPAGLSFTSATGVIVGTPTVVSPATDYTITVYNANTVASGIVNIQVIAGGSFAESWQKRSVTHPVDSIPVIVNDNIVVHQGVSPNGDGINDVFTIEGLNAYPDNQVTIINRSGAVIFEAKGYDNSSKSFNGRSNKNGTLQLPGTYFYVLEYKAGEQTLRKTGYLVLKY